MKPRSLETEELLARMKHDKRMDRLREMTVEQMAEDGCVSLPVACEFLSVGMTSLYKLMNSGLPFAMIGGSRKIPRAALRAYLAAHIYRQR